MTDSRHLYSIVLGLWESLKWRRHGIGLLQAYLCEGENETRVHVWDERLVRSGIRDHGDIHDHRFSFVSTVLAGELTNQLAKVAENPTGRYQVHQVLHARENPEGKFVSKPMECVPGPLRASAKFVDIDFVSHRIRRGEDYCMYRGEFHRTVAHRAVTLVTKCDQIEAGARIMALRDAPPVQAFDPEDVDDLGLAKTMQDVLTEARELLLESSERAKEER